METEGADEENWREKGEKVGKEYRRNTRMKI
jgi:hypothetical protein